MYFFYILYSDTIDSFYIGHSANLDERVRKHNTNHKGFTGRATDWILVYAEEFTSKTLAHARERQVKSWKSRKKIEALLQEPTNE